MGKGARYHYFVEGECEKKLISVLKEQKNLIVPGKIDVLDVTKERLTNLLIKGFVKNIQGILKILTRMLLISMD